MVERISLRINGSSKCTVISLLILQFHSHRCHHGSVWFCICANDTGNLTFFPLLLPFAQPHSVHKHGHARQILNKHHFSFWSNRFPFTLLMSMQMTILCGFPFYFASLFISFNGMPVPCSFKIDVFFSRNGAISMYFYSRRIRKISTFK